MSPNRWRLFKCDLEDVARALASTGRMALARVSETAGGYELSTAKDVFIVRVALRRRGVDLRFLGPWTTAKKGVLLRNLLAKQFEPIIPRLRITLRRRR